MSRKNTGRTPPQNLQNLQQAEARQLARLASSSQLDSRTPPRIQQTVETRLGPSTSRTPPRVLGPRTNRTPPNVLGPRTNRTPPSVLGPRTNRTPPRVLGLRTSTPSSLQQTEAKRLVVNRPTKLRSTVTAARNQTPASQTTASQTTISQSSSQSTSQSTSKSSSRNPSQTTPHVLIQYPDVSLTTRSNIGRSEDLQGK